MHARRAFAKLARSRIETPMAKNTDPPDLFESAPGGLHGVGSSVVNALSDWLEVDVARDRQAHKMRFERGKPIGKLKSVGAVNRRGTIVSFHPDAQIFGKDVHFSPATLYRMAKSK